MAELAVMKLEPIEIDHNQVALITAPPMSHSSSTKRARKSAHPSKTVHSSTGPSSPSMHRSSRTTSDVNSEEPMMTIATDEDELSNLPHSDHIDDEDTTMDADDDNPLMHQQHVSSKRPRLSYDKRLEANARERERVHNLTAAFEALRQVIPMYGDQPKLSRLSILRIACSYVLVLGALNEIDFSEGHNAYTFNESFHMLSSTILSELKRKKTINATRTD